MSRFYDADADGGPSWDLYQRAQYDTASGTLALAVRPAAVAEGSGARGVIAHLWNADDETSYAGLVHYEESLTAYISQGGNTNVCYLYPWLDETETSWVRVAFSWGIHGAIYLDTAAEHTGNATNVFTPDPYQFLLFGAGMDDVYPTKEDFWTGNLAEIGIWNYPLTAAQLAPYLAAGATPLALADALAHEPPPVKPGRLAYLPFGGCYPFNATPLDATGQVEYAESSDPPPAWDATIHPGVLYRRPPLVPPQDAVWPVYPDVAQFVKEWKTQFDRSPKPLIVW